MLFPKSDALVMGFRTLEDAVTWATRKRKFGGCFDQQGDIFVCYWLPKDHPAVNEFAW
jgi:hypothetical protein